MSSSTLSRVMAAPVRAEAAALSASCLLSVLRIGAELGRPWPLALAIDYAIDGKSVPAPLSDLPVELLLVAAGVTTVGLSAVSGLLNMAATRSAERAAERMGAQLRADVFRHSMGLSLRWHDRIRSGELVSRLTSDIGRLLDAVVAATATLVPDLVAVTGVLLLLLIVDPGLAGLGLAVIPVLAVLSIRQRRVVRNSQIEARAAAGRLTGAATDLVRNVAAVQAFGRTDWATAEFGARNADLARVEMRSVDLEARWAPRSDIVLAIGAGLVLVVGGMHVRAGAQTTGHLLVVLAYLSALYSPVRGLTRLSTVLAKAAASADRIDEVLSAEQTVAVGRAPKPGPGPNAGLATNAGIESVSFRDVTFGYYCERPVLSHLTFDVRRGETVCVFGPSGIGKSTALLLMLRLYDVDSGAILIDGLDIREHSVSELRRRIAYVPQDPWLLDATLAQNVAFGSRTATRAQVIAACGTALVDEFVDRLPLGYDTPLGEGASRLSGGQRRRVALARAAVSPATLLLLDEPTASLDAEAAAGVIAAIRSAAADRTTVIVTHDSRLADLADRTIVLDRPDREPITRGGETDEENQPSYQGPGELARP